MEKLLFTGGTGFLGKNARPVLDKMYEVTTCGITLDDMIKANFVTDVPELPERYDVVLHACGKAHVVYSSDKAKINIKRTTIIPQGINPMFLNKPKEQKK